MFLLRPTPLILAWLLWFSHWIGNHGSTAVASGFQSSDPTPTRTSLLPPSIAQVPFSKFEKAEQARAYDEIRHSMQGCWSGSMSVLGMKPHNQIEVKQNPVLNFRLHVDLQGSSGSWTVWNVMEEGDEKVVPLRCSPLERTWQYKVGFPGSLIRLPCAITAELPRCVFEVGFWDKKTRRTIVVEYIKESKWLSGATQLPWRLDETSLVQMKRQPTAGFVGPMTDPRHIAFLPTQASFDMSDWDWTLWETVETEKVDFVQCERTHVRLHDKESRQAVHERVVKAFKVDDASTLVRVLPNSIFMSVPYHLHPSPSDTVRAFFAHAWNDNGMAVIEVQYEGRILHSASFHTFRKK